MVKLYFVFRYIKLNLIIERTKLAALTKNDSGNKREHYYGREGRRMKFKYELSGAGWADGFIEVNTNIEYFSASYISDALHDMLKAIISILPGLVPFPIQSTQFEMHEEPGGTVWTLNKMDTNHLNIKIDSYENLLQRKKLDGSYEESCTISVFVRAVVTSLDLLLQQHGLDGYKEKWINYDFPLKEYLMLKDFLHTEDYF